MCVVLIEVLLEAIDNNLTVNASPEVAVAELLVRDKDAINGYIASGA